MVLLTRFFFSGHPLSRTRKKIQVSRTTFLQREKRWIYKPTFSGQALFSDQKKFEEPFFSSQISWTRFLKPLSYTFLEKCLQTKWSTVWTYIFDKSYEIVEISLVQVYKKQKFSWDWPLLKKIQPFYEQNSACSVACLLS